MRAALLLQTRPLLQRSHRPTKSRRPILKPAARLVQKEQRHQRLIQPLHRLGRRAGCLKILQRGHSPAPGRAHILYFWRQQIQGALPPVGLPIVFLRVQQQQKVLRVARLSRCCQVRQFIQPLGGKLAHHLQHLETAVRLTMQQRFIHQRRQGPQGCCRYLASRLAGKAAAKHGKLGQCLLLIGGEQRPGVVEDRLQAAMAIRHIPGARLQKIEVFGQLFGNFGTAELPHPGRSQLNAQRHASHQTANPGHI